MTVEGWRFLDAAYMAVITISTVGFHEVIPLSDAGRVFTICYLVVGLSTFLYTASAFGERIVQEGVQGWFSYFRKGKHLKAQKNHYIICGAGRVGSNIAEEMSKRGLPITIIDRDNNVFAENEQNGWNWVCGDATDDETLLAANIREAKGLAAVLGSDADNLFVTLSARMIRPDLQIISRASDRKIEEKLKLAGANKVVSLYKTGAARMAQLLANEKLRDFVEIFTDEGSEIDMAEFQVDAIEHLDGQSIGTSKIRECGLIVIGIRRNNGKIDSMPTSGSIVRKGDSIITVGRSADIQTFSESLS